MNRHAIEIMVRQPTGLLSTLRFTIEAEGATAPGLAKLAGKFRHVIAASVVPPPVHVRDFPIIDNPQEEES